MNKKDIILVVIISIIIFIILNNTINKTNNKEHLTPASNEALQNLSSIYNSSNMVTTNLTVTGNFNLLPRGVIVAWSIQNTIPAGWALCDGNNGTPDLRNRFIAGTTPDRIGQTGGSAFQTLTVGNLPPHSHNIITHTGRPQNDGSGGNMKSIPYHWKSFSPDEIPRTDTVGSAQPFSILPPYITLAYIMKL